MRSAILLAALGALLTLSAWNVAAVCDAIAAVYQSGAFRHFGAIVLFVLGIGACVAALVLMARLPTRAIDRDGDIWNHGRNE